ncbi:MAG: Mur ligase family protein, partial [Vulcanimicrobiaceae bacterium]
MSVVDFHFVGIGGIGMSALARLALAGGSTVSGCDVKDSPLLRALRSEGARVLIGHSRDHVSGAAELVVTSAVNVKAEEVTAARDAGIPVTTRGALLARFVDVRRGIAICGTHGKTTTTAMTHAALRGGNIDAGLALGGIDVALGTNAVVGTSAWFVTEADESDGSFALLHPNIAVLTNLEEDHVNDAGEMERLVASFQAFFAELPSDGYAIVGIDNARSAQIAGLSRTASTITFGFSEAADIRATHIDCAGLGSSFDIELRGEYQGRVYLHVPGRINIENALAAIAVAHAAGVSFSDIATGLAKFMGVRRRF